MLNREIKAAVESAGFECILPQDILPPGPDVDSVRVFESNVEAVRRSDCVLSILDSPGEGVMFELGFATALGKPTILFRSDRQSYLGKVIEGVWTSAPSSRKATSLAELSRALEQIAQELEVS